MVSVVVRRSWFSILNATFPKPDLLVYLHRPVDVLLQQIRKRGREIEKNISAVYLEEIQNAYFDYLKTESERAVVILELGDANFQEDDRHFERIVELIGAPYSPGITQISMY